MRVRWDENDDTEPQSLTARVRKVEAMALDAHRFCLVMLIVTLVNTALIMLGVWWRLP